MAPKQDEETGRALSMVKTLPEKQLTEINEQPPCKTGVNEQEIAEKKKIKFRLWKDCFVLTGAWLSLYMGYNSISAVQSSLNSVQGLGVVTLCIEFASMTFGNLFTDSAIIKRLGCKWTIALGMAVYSVYMAANFHPSWYTFVPLAAISGITSAAMWVAQSTYITRLGQEYAERMGVNADNTKSRFIGILYMGYLGSNVIGNAVSSLILGSKIMDSGSVVDPNAYNPYQHLCGAVYCNEDLGTDFYAKKNKYDQHVANSSFAANQTLIDRGPGMMQIYAFCGFCVGAGIFAALVVTFFLDALPSLGIDENAAMANQSSLKLLTASIRQWKNPNQLLLIPISLYNGMDNPFLSSEFTKAYVTCAIGIHFIGFVMVCYGVTSPISAFISGFSGKGKYRITPFVLAYLAHVCTAIGLLYWTPTAGNVIEMFVFTGVWGLGTGVWSAQVPTFYSIIFMDNLEAAFSNSRLWDAAGRTMSYGWSYPLCMRYKIYIIISLVTLGMLGLIGVEIRHWKINKSRKGEENKASEVMYNEQAYNPVLTPTSSTIPLTPPETWPESYL